MESIESIELRKERSQPFIDRKNDRSPRYSNHGSGFPITNSRLADFEFNHGDLSGNSMAVQEFMSY
jgi:hypothetical protein